MHVEPIASNVPEPAARPGIFKVFWPALLGWASLVAAVGASRLKGESVTSLGSTRSFLDLVETAGLAIALVSPIAGICVTVLFPGARTWRALSLNVVVFAWLFFFLRVVQLVP